MLGLATRRSSVKRKIVRVRLSFVRGTGGRGVPGHCSEPNPRPSGVIASLKLVTRDPVTIRTVQRHQPGLLTQFDGNENCAIIADGERGCGRCLHLTSPMVRVCKPKPTGKASLTAPWNLRTMPGPAGARGGRIGSGAQRAAPSPSAPSTEINSLPRSAPASRSPSRPHRDVRGCRRAG